MSIPENLPSKCNVFISQSMQHSSIEKFLRERQCVIASLKALYPDVEFNVIQQQDMKVPDDWKEKNPRALRWAQLGKSIEMMGEADLIVFVNDGIDTDIAPGCKSEYAVVINYFAEYPASYKWCTLSDLRDALTETTGQCDAFENNIIECVKVDIKKYSEYFQELVNIMRPLVPELDFNRFDINDNSTEWFVEYQHESLEIHAALNKCALIDDDDYDLGRFFVFMVEEYKEGQPVSSITIRSINTDNHTGLYIDTSSYDDSSKYANIFEALMEYVELLAEDIEELE